MEQERRKEEKERGEKENIPPLPNSLPPCHSPDPPSWHPWNPSSLGISRQYHLFSRPQHPQIVLHPLLQIQAPGSRSKSSVRLGGAGNIHAARLAQKGCAHFSSQEHGGSQLTCISDYPALGTQAVLLFLGELVAQVSEKLCSGHVAAPSSLSQW